MRCFVSIHIIRLELEVEMVVTTPTMTLQTWRNGIHIIKRVYSSLFVIQSAVQGEVLRKIRLGRGQEAAEKTISGATKWRYAISVPLAASALVGDQNA